MRMFRVSMWERKRSANSGSVVEQPDHRLFLDDQHAARRHRGRRLDANRLTGQRALAEEVAGPQHRDDRLFADPGEHRELDRALLEVPDVSGRIALCEHDLSRPILHNPSCRPCRLEIRLRIEGVRRFRARLLSWDCRDRVLRLSCKVAGLSHGPDGYVVCEQPAGIGRIQGVQFDSFDPDEVSQYVHSHRGRRAVSSRRTSSTVSSSARARFGVP